MTETAAPKPAPKPEFTLDSSAKQIKSVGGVLCKKCGSKKLTDLNGEVFCPQKAKDCPFV